MLHALALSTGQLALAFVFLGTGFLVAVIVSPPVFEWNRQRANRARRNRALRELALEDAKRRHPAGKGL